MTFFRAAVLTGCALATGSKAASAQITIREITITNAVADKSFGAILDIRELSNGGVLVNDGGRRQLLLLNLQLKQSAVVLDSAGSAGRAYGPRPAPLIRYVGDSTLFVDGQARALLVLSPTGDLARVMAPVQPNDLVTLSYLPSGGDREGRLIYQSTDRSKPDPKRPNVMLRADSAPIVRANFETRRIDTLARVRLRVTTVRTESREVGSNWEHTNFVNPLPIFDEWAVTEDGSVAIVRGHDYHVDFIRQDGSKHSGPKIPFAWRPLTKADKEALVDSSRKARLVREQKSDNAPGSNTTGLVSSATLQARSTGAPVSSPPKFLEREVEIDEIPEYWPPVRRGSIRADRDGNIWMLPTTSSASLKGELIYDVADGRGNLLYRVRIPSGKAIAGFGRNGTIYLMQRSENPAQGWSLEKARLK